MRLYPHYLAWYLLSGRRRRGIFVRFDDGECLWIYSGMCVYLGSTLKQVGHDCCKWCRLGSVHQVDIGMETIGLLQWRQVAPFGELWVGIVERAGIALNDLHERQGNK